ncbi:MAG: hypothetical protein ACFFAE_10880 [Candidatus Hodarchaeota archaeon]
MLADRKVVFECWMCGRKDGDEYHGLISEKKDKKQFLLTNQAQSFNMKINLVPFETPQIGTVKIPICIFCSSLIQGIITSLKLKEEIKEFKETDLLYI